MIASPEKAICDKIIMTSGILLRSTKRTRELLIEDMRIEEQMLQKLEVKEIASWTEHTIKKSSIQMLVQTLRAL